MSENRVSGTGVRQTGEWTLRYQPELEQVAVEIMEGLLHLKEGENSRKVKTTGGRRSIWIASLPGVKERQCFVKHYGKPGLLKQLKHVFRKSRTRQEWEMGTGLERTGLPVARHVLMAERKKIGLLQEDYLVQEALEGYQNFDAWFRENWEAVRSGPAVHDRREVIKSLASLIRRMHDSGVLQRDFKPDSIMVGPQGDFKLVDLERALVRRRSLSLGERLDNLAKVDHTFGFICSATDRLRFLRHYFGPDLPDKKLRRYAAIVSPLAELKFRKRARERRVWTEVQNETYELYEHRGFRVCAHRTLPREFMEEVADRIEKGYSLDLFTYPAPGHEGEKLAGRWCDARTAMAHAPGLFYRRVPFLPPRAAVSRGKERWGLLLYLVPPPPMLPWKEAFEDARQKGAEHEPASDLGRSLRVMHRMGITWREHTPDAMLYDPEATDHMLRFYINRPDLLLLDRTPSSNEAQAILDTVAGLLGLSPEAARLFKKAYFSCLLRWFRAPNQW